jgi:ribosomal protein S18 acetylase RimI-like enzyme
MTDTIELIAADMPALLAEVTELAHVIWHQHYTPIIGRAQVAYMLAEGYNADALRAQVAAGTRFTLARLGSRFVAFAGLSPDPAVPDNAWLDKLYVHANARHYGIGRALVAHAARQAGASGADTLRLRVNRHNTESIAAYRRLGFESDGEDVKDIGNGFVMDDYIMSAPTALLDNHRRGSHPISARRMK